MAAMGAFRAADPARFANETGWDPSEAGVAGSRWRSGLRIAGTLLLSTAFAIAVAARGTLEGSLIATSAAMLASLSVILAAPVFERITWGAIVVSAALSPVALVFLSVYGGTHGL